MSLIHLSDTPEIQHCPSIKLGDRYNLCIIAAEDKMDPTFPIMHVSL